MKVKTFKAQLIKLTEVIKADESILFFNNKSINQFN